MNHPLLARIALSSLCAIQASATVAIDFNRTHATNPHWPGHARFHLVWQGCTVVFLSGIELGLIWLSLPFADGRFYLAALLAGLSPLGFLVALIARRVFGGTLSDPNGIPPARLGLFGTVRSFDVNFVAVLLALASLLAMVLLYHS